jgi:hypothetical protein
VSAFKPLRPKRKKAAAAPDFTKIIADARAEVAKAETAAFMARLDAIDIILEDVQPHDVLMVCAHALARAIPLCCEKHEDEFKAEFLRLLSDCVVQEREFEDAAAAAEGDGGDAPRRVH